MKPDIQTVAMILGSISVILLPAGVTILYQVWSKTMATLERNTHAIVDLKSKLDLLWEMSKRIPKLESDVSAAHDKLRRRDKDHLLKNE